MTIYSWNVLFRNKRLDEAFAFIQEADADIFCLQEVPETLLARLEHAFPHIAFAMDAEHLFSRAAIPAYNVIVSRYPIRVQSIITLPEYEERLPRRARLARLVLRPFSFSLIRNRNGVFADLETPAGLVRVFNLHLILAHPGWRLEEFEHALQYREPDTATIVCGDFNILESLKVSVLNWLLGGSIADALRHKRERATIEERFLAHGLMNVLKGMRTHPFSRSQLDHILVSHSLRPLKSRVFAERYGSDHCPVEVEIEQ